MRPWALGRGSKAPNVDTKEGVLKRELSGPGGTDLDPTVGFWWSCLGPKDAKGALADLTWVLAALGAIRGSGWASDDPVWAPKMGFWQARKEHSKEFLAGSGVPWGHQT